MLSQSAFKELEDYRKVTPSKVKHYFGFTVKQIKTEDIG